MRRYGIGVAEVARPLPERPPAYPRGGSDRRREPADHGAGQGQATTAEALGQTVVREREGSGPCLEISAASWRRRNRGWAKAAWRRCGLGATRRQHQGGGRSRGAGPDALGPAVKAAGLSLRPDTCSHRPSSSIWRFGTSSPRCCWARCWLRWSGGLPLRRRRRARPLSLLAALIVLDLLGFGINALTLGGLAIALGEVVDDAIMLDGATARRLRDNRRSASAEKRGRRWVLAASKCGAASSTPRSSSPPSVFVPVLTLTGVQALPARSDWPTSSRSSPRWSWR